MMTTEPTPAGVLWHGRYHHFAGGAIDPPTNPASQRIDRQLRENFPSEMRDIDQALERGVARVERERKALARPDG